MSSFFLTMVFVGVVLGGGWAAFGVHAPRLGVTDKVSPPVSGGYQDMVPWIGGGGLAARAGERGALVSSDMEEGVEDEVSDALCRIG